MLADDREDVNLSDSELIPKKQVEEETEDDPEAKLA